MSKSNSNKKKKRTESKKSGFPKAPLIAGILVASLAIGLGISAIIPKNSAQTSAATADGVKPHLDGAQSFLNDPASVVAASENVNVTPTTNQDGGEGVASGSGEEEPDWSSDGTGSGGNGNSGGGGGSNVHWGGFGDNSTPRPSGDSSSGYVSGIQVATPVPLPTISFPYSIPSSNLVVEQISPYTGYFLEDGSDRSVSNIAAIVVTNNGEALDFAGIGINQGMTSYAFSASQIPAHSTVIIQEQSGAVLAAGDYNSCTATTTPSSGVQTSTERVKVTDNGNNTFEVANLSDSTIPEVTVYFKNYLPDEDVYVGGITYHVTLNNIEPGTGVDVNSDHYASGYSVIVDIDVAG